MRSAFVVCLVLVCFVHNGNAAPGDILKDIGHAFDTVWNSIVDAVNKPHKHKKTGVVPDNNMKPDTGTEKSFLWRATKDPVILRQDMSRKAAANIQVTLPLLLHPKYKSLATWYSSGPFRSTTKQFKFDVREETEPRDTGNPSAGFSETCYLRDTTSSLKFVKLVASEDTENVDSDSDEANIFGPLVFLK